MSISARACPASRQCQQKVTSDNLSIVKETMVPVCEASILYALDSQH